MDYVQGELLIYRLKHSREIEKTLLFEWMRELLHQIEQFHRCFGSQGYRYVNPYSVLVTADGGILLLDLEAESNEFVLRNMQKRAMRDHFVKPIVQIRENTKLSLDLYGYAKTIQFILANVHVEPSLTSREENRLEKIIDKCLCKNSKKQYEDLKQIQRDLPAVRSRGRKQGKKLPILWLLIPAAAVILAVSCLYYVRKRESEEQARKLLEQAEGLGAVLQEMQEQVVEEDPETEGGIHNPDGTEEEAERETKRETKRQGSKAYPQDGMKELEDHVDALQEYVLQNTAEDNREIIEQGETLKRELFRYLAAAYDREEMKEQALEAYQILCGTEIQEELLESAYLRRITLEKERNKETALATGKEALSRIPDSQPLAEKALEVLAEMEDMTGEEYRKELETLEGFYPDLKSLECYHKLEEQQDSRADAE